MNQDEVREKFGDAAGSTMVTTVYARAYGGQAFDIPEWHDAQALDVVHRLIRAGVDVPGLSCHNKANVVGTIRRSQCIDTAVEHFRARHQGPVQVVSLGIGLCNRAHRLRKLRDVHFYGVDRQPALELRASCIPHDQVQVISGDATTGQWLNALDSSLPTLVIAEGLLMYLTQEQVAQMLKLMGQRLAAGSEFIADTFAKLFRHRAEITTLTGAEYTFAATARELAGLSLRWQLERSFDVMSSISPLIHFVLGFSSAITRQPLPYGVHLLRLRANTQAEQRNS